MARKPNELAVVRKRAIAHLGDGVIFSGMNRLTAMIFLFVALLRAPDAAAQDSSQGLVVLVSPALLVPVSVAVQAGVQLPLPGRWALLVEGAYPVAVPEQMDYESIRRWRAGLEVKRFSRRRGSHRYLSVQAAYLYRRLVRANQDLYYTPTQTFSFTRAVIQSPVLSTALKLGTEVAAGRRVVVDLFGGLGFRFVLTSYEAESAVLTSVQPKRQTLLDFDEAWRYNYTLVRLHVTAGVRVGVRL